MAYVSCHCHCPVKSRGSVAPTFLITEKKIFIIVQYPQALLEPSTVVCKEVGVGKLSKQKAWLQHSGGNYCWYDVHSCLAEWMEPRALYAMNAVLFVMSCQWLKSQKASLHIHVAAIHIPDFFQPQRLFRKGRKIDAVLLMNMCTVVQNIHEHFHHQPC